MKLPLYQIDAFAAQPFEGNPAAVCPLQTWLPDEVMQAIAAENNLSETAFFVPTEAGFQIRWFTPTAEVDLCGHATLASAYVVFKFLDYPGKTVKFSSRSGPLIVKQDQAWLVMDFPAQPPTPCEIPPAVMAAFTQEPQECLTAEDLILVYEREQDIQKADPNLAPLLTLAQRGVIITARSDRCDFAARFFAPKYGIPEDPVTGSAYTQLAPYWASRLGTKRFHVKQLSARGGELFCEPVEDRVLISGQAVKYLEGTLYLGPDTP
jgi:PhzF family phenazine biosynthesis protein